jgi:hypothetical protein
MDLKLKILEILASGMPEREANLLYAVRMSMGSAGVTTVDFTLAVRELEAKGWVAGTRSQGGYNVWAITDAGKLAIASL